jgi:hypothetical protein
VSAIQENLLEMAVFKPNGWPTTKVFTWIRKITPPCKDITRLLSQSIDRRLPMYRRLGVWLHFTVCESCLRYANHLAFIRQVSRSMAEHLVEMSPASLPEAAKERISHEFNGAHR